MAMVFATLGALIACTAVALAASHYLVRSLERVAARLGLTEAMLGLVAALAANSPEISSSVTALVRGERDIGIGVILGSNVFNLAALLGLGAIVARRIRLHRDVVVVAGGVGGWAALMALAVVAGGVGPPAGLGLVLVLLLPYVAVAAVPALVSRFPVPDRWRRLVRRAIADEERELEEAIHPDPATRRDVVLAGVTLAAVVVASAGMEATGAGAGVQLGVPMIVVGGVLLAAVTSLPNAVAAVYLARRGRGAAVLSETMNSNTLNVVLGLLVPACIVGLRQPAGEGAIVAAVAVCALTACALLLAYAGHGLGRMGGWILIGGYLVYLVAILRL